MQRAFSAIDIPIRPTKPRSAGLTMMIDWGLPPATQREMLEFTAEFVDLAKVAVGISGLVAEEALVHKIEMYRADGIEPFPGGMFLELAYQQDKVQHYYTECRRVGYRLIEVSDNVVRFESEVREHLIHQAVEEYDLRVLGEVGSKHVETDPDTLIADIQSALDAGAWKVFVEAAEFVTKGTFDTALVETLVNAVDPADILFELPGKWISDVHAHQVYRMMVWLVEHVGPTVNIGNVAPADVVALETLRTGVGVNMKF